MPSNIAKPKKLFAQQGYEKPQVPPGKVTYGEQCWSPHYKQRSWQFTMMKILLAVNYVKLTASLLATC